MELFIVRMNALDAGFSPTREELASIGTICRRLDGIPLAIEFAAASAATLGISSVARGLRDRFALLTGGRRTALARQRTLRATLDWSYDLLPETEQRLLRYLSIFSGGFTLAAAAAMNDFTQDMSAVTDGIANLVAKSLVVMDRAESEIRWYLLETTRAYAFDKLAKSGEARRIAQRHAEFCSVLFSPFATEEQHQAPIHDLRPWRREIDNLRSALVWAFSANGDASLGVALATAAADFWSAISLVAESCKWANKALKRIGDAEGTRSEMILRYHLGLTLMITKGMTDGARAALMRAMTLAREHADFEYQQRATISLWLFSCRAGAFHDALARAREYEEVVRLDDARSRPVADWLVGIPLIYLGAHVEASERLQRVIDHDPIASLGRHNIIFGADLRSIVLINLSVSFLSRGLLDAASRTAMSAIEVARGTNAPAALCFALAGAAGFVFLGLDELHAAARYGDELVDHAQKYALGPFHATGLCVRGSLAVRRGDPNAGIDPLRRGLTGMQEATLLLYYPYFMAQYASALGAIGRNDDGLAEIDTALRIAEDTGYHWFVPEITRVKGELFALRGSDHLAVSEALFRGSMHLAREQHALYWELSAAISLADLLRGQNRAAEAREALAPVYGRFTEGFSAAKLHRAKILLDLLH